MNICAAREISGDVALGVAFSQNAVQNTQWDVCDSPLQGEAARSVCGVRDLHHMRFLFQRRKHFLWVIVLEFFQTRAELVHT